MSPLRADLRQGRLADRGPPWPAGLHRRRRPPRHPWIPVVVRIGEARRANNRGQRVLPFTAAPG